MGRQRRSLIELTLFLCEMQFLHSKVSSLTPESKDYHILFWWFFFFSCLGLSNLQRHARGLNRPAAQWSNNKFRKLDLTKEQTNIPAVLFTQN